MAGKMRGGQLLVGLLALSFGSLLAAANQCFLISLCDTANLNVNRESVQVTS